MVGILDWGIWITYFVLMFLLLMVYRNTKKESYYRFFLAGFVLKIMGGLGFAMIYVYYYGFGDTFAYFNGSGVLADALVDDPGSYFRLIFSSADSFSGDLRQYTSQIVYSTGHEEWFMIKLLSPFTFLSFKSYIVITLFTSLFSFVGAWKLFLVFRRILPNKDFLSFVAAFLIPSTLFWGGGIMKDTLTLGCINLLIYYTYELLFENRWVFKYIFGSIMCIVLIYMLKAYILLCFVPALLFGINALMKVKFDNPIIRRLMNIIVIGVSVVLVFAVSNFVGENSQKYSVGGLESRVKGFHTWHTFQGGSAYDLGVTDYSPVGVLTKIPASLNVTFFRPYLWEARNPVILIAAVESLVFFILLMAAIFSRKLKIFSSFASHPMIVIFGIYCLIFGFVVGFTSYNFGALARYKIPIFSLFAFLIIYINIYRKEKTKPKKIEVI